MFGTPILLLLLIA